MLKQLVAARDTRRARVMRSPAEERAFRQGLCLPRHIVAARDTRRARAPNAHSWALARRLCRTSLPPGRSAQDNRFPKREHVYIPNINATFHLRTRMSGALPQGSAHLDRASVCQGALLEPAILFPAHLLLKHMLWPWLGGLVDMRAPGRERAIGGVSQTGARRFGSTSRPGVCKTKLGQDEILVLHLFFGSQNVISALAFFMFFNMKLNRAKSQK